MASFEDEQTNGTTFWSGGAIALPSLGLTRILGLVGVQETTFATKAGGLLSFQRKGGSNVRL